MFHDGINLLFAKTKSHCLLQDGSPKLIGEVFYAKRYLLNNTIVLQSVVKFHYGDKNINDLFIFENQKLIFSSISLYTDAFLTDTYRELVKTKIITPEAFISIVTEIYTQKEMGF